MKTWALTRFTLKETIRSKAMITGLVVSLLYLALVPALSASSGSGAVVGDEQIKIAASRDFLNFALTGLNFIGIFMAIFTTLGTIYSEIENGTIVSVVTKPVSRAQVILGKWLGHASLMAAYVLIMGVALWLSVTLGSGIMVWRFFASLGLVCLNVVTMVSLTIVFSTFLPIVANAIFVFLMMVITSNLRIFNAIAETSENIVVSVIANIFRLLLPVSEVSDLAGQHLAGKSEAASLGASVDASTFAPRGWSFLYEIVYLSAMVLLAMYIFRQKDLN